MAALVQRARLALALGFAEMAKDELPCNCFYGDGLPRYVTPDRKPAHRCGR